MFGVMKPIQRFGGLVLLHLSFVCLTTVQGRGDKEYTKLMSLNAGLTLEIPYTEQRKNTAIRLLKESSADFVGIQEVWFGRHVRDFVQELKDQYPYSYSELRKPNGQFRLGPACTETDIPTLLCVFNENCLGRPSREEQGECGISKCDIFGKISQKCYTCSLLTFGDPDTLVRECINGTYDINVSGLLLLSKRPLSNVREVDLEPGFIQLRKKLYLQAEVEGLGEVITTHLTSYIGPDTYLEFHLPYGSYDNQHKGEVQRILQTACGKDRAIVLGDLNAGPRVPKYKVSGLLEDGYMDFIRAGFRSGYMDLNGRCTYCTDNPLTGTWPTNLAINHVMTKGYEVIDAKRIVTKRPYSDHWAIEVTLKNSRK